MVPTRTSIYDLEGIVVKEKSDPYLVEHAAWLKIRNQGYSQWVGREELFERERTPSHKSTTFSPWTKAEQAPPKSQSRV